MGTELKEKREAGNPKRGKAELGGRNSLLFHTLAHAYA